MKKKVFLLYQKKKKITGYIYITDTVIISIITNK